MPTTTEVIREARAAAREGRPFGTLGVVRPSVTFTDSLTKTPAGPVTLRCLVVRHPWAGEIITGEKPEEFRCWLTHHRGPLAIACAKGHGAGELGGHVIGVVELVDCRRLGEKDFAWVLANPRRIKPVKIAGRLGLFEVTIPANIHAQLAVIPCGGRTPTPRRRIHPSDAQVIRE